MVEAGHNNPPGEIERSASVTEDLNKWMTDHPVIQTEDEARDAKLLLDRGKLCIKDLDDEKAKLTLPLNEALEAIYARYRSPRQILGKVIDELKRRSTDWIAKEQAQRIKVAQEARQKAQELERQALQAEQRERDIIADAKVGAVGNVAEAISAADAAFSDAKRAQRQARLAERDTNVKIGGGFTRAMSLREKETLIVKDPTAAIKAIGLTPAISAAILAGARSFRTLHGELPPGIERTTEKTI